MVLHLLFPFLLLVLEHILEELNVCVLLVLEGAATRVTHDTSPHHSGCCPVADGGLDRINLLLHRGHLDIIVANLSRYVDEPLRSFSLLLLDRLPHPLQGVHHGGLLLNSFPPHMRVSSFKVLDLPLEASRYLFPKLGHSSLHNRS